MPDFSFESEYDFICGLDEVGRAPLAGPVVAACVYIPLKKRSENIWQHVNDSKKIAEPKRRKLSEDIKRHACWAIGESVIEEIEELNIVQASFLAMRRAYETMCQNFSMHVTHALIDGNLTPDFPCPTTSIVKGDSKSVSIAAASILAKVYRDDLMTALAEEHPFYGWERNVGYPTRQHLNAINTYGITAHHRKTFAPVRNFLEFGNVESQMKLAV